MKKPFPIFLPLEIKNQDILISLTSIILEMHNILCTVLHRKFEQEGFERKGKSLAAPALLI